MASIKYILFVLLLAVLALGLIKVLTGCAAPSGPRTEAALFAALDALGHTGNTTSEITKRACVAKQDAENVAARAGTKTTEDARLGIERIRARCAELRSIFDRLRVLQNEAVDLAQSDALEQARAKLREVEALWGGLLKEGVLP